MRNCFLLGALAGCVLCFNPRVHASPIASDSFEGYTTGATALNQNGGSGFTAAYTSDNSNAVNIATESLSYTSGGLTVAGGSKDLHVSAATTGSFSNTGGGVDNNTLDRTFAAQTGTLYFGFLLRAGAGATSSNEFFQLGLSNTSGEPALSVGASGGAASTFDFFVRNPAGTGNQTTSTTILSPSTTYFIVGKASITGTAGANYDRIDLYVDPGSTEPAIATISRTANSGMSSLSSFNIRTARFATGDVYSVDDIVIANTYADVVAAPEPASGGLLLLACLGLLARRRCPHLLLQPERRE